MTRTKIILHKMPYLLLGCLLISSCSIEKSETIPPTNPFTNNLQSLSKTNVPKLEELEQITISNLGAIAGINYRVAKNELSVVNMGDGSLETWSLDSKSQLADFDLGIITPKGLGFDGVGDYLIGATRHEFRDDNGDGIPVEYIDDIKVWNTQTGDLTFCATLCSEQSNATRPSPYLSAGLSPTGQLAYEYDKIGMKIDNFETNQSKDVFLSSPDYYWHYVGRITFNSTGERYAVAYQEGAVRIFSQVLNKGILSPEISRNVDKDFQSIPALVFSPEDKWLARIRADKITIWRVLWLGGKLKHEFDFPNAKLLAFDYTEDLLFVGSDKEITIINLADMSTVATLSTPNLTALTISSDNRLLIWGDSMGTIHVWGIP